MRANFAGVMAVRNGTHMFDGGRVRAESPGGQPSRRRVMRVGNCEGGNGAHGNGTGRRDGDIAPYRNGTRAWSAGRGRTKGCATGADGEGGAGRGRGEGERRRGFIGGGGRGFRRRWYAGGPAL